MKVLKHFIMSCFDCTVQNMLRTITTLSISITWTHCHMGNHSAFVIPSHNSPVFLASLFTSSLSLGVYKAAMLTDVFVYQQL
uniref:Uncharacterized protein n=1 Tax=Arion vulgaris TaxID=1028688 RepID=A0A0B6XYR5_9EUPU